MDRDTNSPLTWHGRPILTVALAAARHDVDQAAMRQALRRPPMRDLPPLDPPPLDARTPAWDQAAFDAAWDSRPGRGVNLRGHG
jgi:hypothetical protein